MKDYNILSFIISYEINREKLLALLKQSNANLQNFFNFDEQEPGYVIYNNKTNTFYSDFSYIVTNTIKIENENLLLNVLKVLKTLNTFNYFIETTRILELPDKSKFISSLLFKSKHLIIIKDLENNKEYLITEDNIVDCNDFLSKKVLN
jgi:hypothetical protein